MCRHAGALGSWHIWSEQKQQKEWQRINSIENARLFQGNMMSKIYVNDWVMIEADIIQSTVRIWPPTQSFKFSKRHLFAEKAPHPRCSIYREAPWARWGAGRARALVAWGRTRKASTHPHRRCWRQGCTLRAGCALRPRPPTPHSTSKGPWALRYPQAGGWTSPLWP